MNPQRFAVRQRHWREVVEAGDGRWLTRLPGATPVGYFTDAASAAAEQGQRESVVRARVNPFRCGHDLADLTGLPIFAFKDWLLEAGLRPAKADSFAEIHWDRWWFKNARTWTADQRRHVWDALDKVRFFEVTHRPEGVESVFVLVQALAWGEAMSQHYPFRSPEGGRLRGAFRRVVDAEAARRLMAEQAGGRLSPRSLRSLAAPARNVFTGAKEPFDQILEIDFTQPAAALADPWPSRVWCVARRAVSVAMRRDRGVIGPQLRFDAVRGPDGEPEDHLVPEAAFADPAEAGHYCQEAEAAIRKLVNPCRFAHVLEWAVEDVFPGGDDRFAALGLPMPANPGHLVTWWAEQVAVQDARTVGAAWDLLDGVRFYRVVELELDAG